MIQAIQQLASDLAKQINENKSEDGYTIICTHLELRFMVEDAIGSRGRDTYELHMEDRAMNDFFDEMEDTHNMFLTISQYDDVVLDEREEEL